MEVWDLYDINRNKIGRHVRGQKIPDNAYHLVVHVWIKNKKGQFLISQRSPSKRHCPLMWECCGGAVIKEESSLQAALREVKEELGIDLLPENGQLILTKVRKELNGERFNDIVDVWMFEYDGDVSLENATTDEVVQFKWLYFFEIEDLYKQKQLVWTLSYFFDTFKS